MTKNDPSWKKFVETSPPDRVRNPLLLFQVSIKMKRTPSTVLLLVLCTLVIWNSNKSQEKNKLKTVIQKKLKKLVSCWVSLVQNMPRLFAHHVSRSVQNTSSKVKLLIKSTMHWVLFAKPCLNVFSNGLLKLSTVLFPHPFQDLSSSVSSVSTIRPFRIYMLNEIVNDSFQILLVSKFSNSTPSNNSALTSPMKNSNNSSTITCSFLNKKNISVKVSNGK